tara:strand:+ start:2141 stop:2383 length:243 start_codon:yes stop_codon:yes gene_type:complete
MNTQVKSKIVHSDGTQCRCEQCAQTAIDLAEKVARRTDTKLSVVETKEFGICIYDEGTAKAQELNILRVIYQTRNPAAVA